MAWLNPFLLGRPGFEYLFDVNPAAMQISEGGVVVLQRNLAGDLKKSVLKASAPTIRISSSYLTLAQRNLFNSLPAIQDTFLSFQVRDDLQVTDELATNLTTTQLQLANSSATRLSNVLVSNGFGSVITIQTPFKFVAGGTVYGYGSGPYGGGVYGDSTFDPGAVTYDDTTRIITLTNPIPDVSQPVLVTYTYKGWLMNLKQFDHAAQGGWLDRFTYDFELQGA